MFGSRTTNKTNFITVASKRYLWKSSEENFGYYDSEAEERIALPEGAIIVPLTATMSVTGVRERDHNKATQRYNNIFSNEFTHYTKDIVKVQEKDKLDGTKTVLAEGPYSPTVKDIIADMPFAKFTKNIYGAILSKDGKSLSDEVVKISLSASSLRPWIEFENKAKDAKVDLYNGHGFSIGKSTSEQNGTVSYKAPTFNLHEISEDVNKAANTKAAEVEDLILRNKQAAGTDEPTTEFTPPAAKKEQSDSDDGSIDLSEIPF